jgi:hypothetical protein
MFSADRFHPSAAGYARVAAVLLPTICTALSLEHPHVKAPTPNLRRGEGMDDVRHAARRAAASGGTEVAPAAVDGATIGPRGPWAQVRKRIPFATLPGLPRLVELTRLADLPKLPDLPTMPSLADLHLDEMLNVVRQRVAAGPWQSQPEPGLAESDLAGVDLAGVDLAGVDLAGVDPAGSDPESAGPHLARPDPTRPDPTGQDPAEPNPAAETPADGLPASSQSPQTQ